MCCGSYRGRLRAIKLFLWLHGSAEYIKWVCGGLRHNSCFDGFRPRLRLTWMLLWLQGIQMRTTKMAFATTGLRAQT